MDTSWCTRRSKELRSGAPDKIRTCIQQVSLGISCPLKLSQDKLKPISRDRYVRSRRFVFSGAISIPGPHQIFVATHAATTEERHSSCRLI